jgi:hypothetical protein
MDKTVRTFDPSQVKITLALPSSATVISGYADGTFVKITRTGDAFENKRGSDGTVDRINKNAYDFTVEITLKQTSPYNAILSGILATDQLTNNGVFPLTVVDLSGPAAAPSTFFAPQAWVVKDPEVDYGDALKNHTWKFATGAGTNFIAGN